MKISILTPSNRDVEGLKIIEKALRRQSFTDFEWIIGSPSNPSEVEMNYKWIVDPEKDEGDYWVLNKLYNKMIEAAEGELIVSIQDYTSLTPEGLSKFWFHYNRNNDVIVSGVGNKYSDDSFISKVWQDPRERQDGDSFYECYFADIEGNYCAVPKHAIYEVGGFDEHLDKFAGMDWYSVLARMHLSNKFKFFLDQTNKSFSLVHGRYEDWEEKNAIHGPYQDRVKHYTSEGYRLDYLR